MEGNPVPARPPSGNENGIKIEAKGERDLSKGTCMGSHTGCGSPNLRTPHQDPEGRRLAQLSLTALGVVFGDIGTSPLYAIRECFYGEYGIPVTQGNVLGVLSLMFWALLLIVTLKYLTFVVRADNHGEGGVLALTALVKGKGTDVRRARRNVLVTIGLFGACLLYGDGMITPAISVLSAVGGIRIVTPLFTPYVVPVTVAILSGLFLLQHHGVVQRKARR